MVVAVGTGVIKANEPKMLKKFGRSLELTERWLGSKSFKEYGLGEEERNNRGS